MMIQDVTKQKIQLKPEEIHLAINKFTAIENREPLFINLLNNKPVINSDLMISAHVLRLMFPMVMFDPDDNNILEQLTRNFSKIAMSDRFLKKKLKMTLTKRGYKEVTKFTYLIKDEKRHVNYINQKDSLRCINLASLKGDRFETVFKDFNWIYSHTREFGSASRPVDPPELIAERLKHIKEHVKSDTQNIVLVGYLDGNPVATASAYALSIRKVKIYYLADVNTIPECQSQGIGKAIVNQVIHRLGGCNENVLIFLSIMGDNQLTFKLFERLGFRQWFKVSCWQNCPVKMPREGVEPS